MSTDTNKNHLEHILLQVRNLNRMYSQRETSRRMDRDSVQFQPHPKFPEFKEHCNTGAATGMIKVPRVCASTEVLVLQCSKVRTLFFGACLTQAPVCQQECTSMTKIT